MIPLIPVLLVLVASGTAGPTQKINTAPSGGALAVDRAGARAPCGHGVLLPVAQADRQVRLLIGSGGTAQRTAADMAQILNRDIRPWFGARDFPLGINNRVAALAASLTPTRGTTT